MYRTMTVLAGMAALALAGCQTTGAPSTKEMQVSQELAPMPEPEAPRLGEVAIQQEGDGEEIRVEVTEITEDEVAFKDSTGCRWRRSRQYDLRFAPTVEWEGCSGSTGTRGIEGRSGDPVWPLEVGKSWSYSATGYTDSSWTSDTRCEVTGTARIETVGGQHDTYKVVCQSKWAKRTRYISPELGHTVRFEREALAGSATNREWELVRVEAPASS